jgi:hypothetical protein
MTQHQAPKAKRRSVRGYAFALFGVVVLGGLYFWANTGPAGAVDPRSRPLDSASAVPVGR